MLKDRFGREITYLRVSVTDKCNLKCRYCRPESGIELKDHKDILSLEEIYEVVKYFVSKGIKKVRITGGEPLVRKNVIHLVKMIIDLDGVEDFGLTTNGILLPKYAKELRRAGLKRINISLDTLNPDKYSYLTRGGDLDKALAGIEAAKEAGFNPIKINTVVIDDYNKDDLDQLRHFCDENNLQIRYIKEMNLEKGTRAEVLGGEGGKCNQCNRLRLTCDGKIKPCLFSEDDIDLRKITVEEALLDAVISKPECGMVNKSQYMNQIGG